MAVAPTTGGGFGSREYWEGLGFTISTLPEEELSEEEGPKETAQDVSGVDRGQPTCQMICGRYWSST